MIFSTLALFTKLSRSASVRSASSFFSPKYSLIISLGESSSAPLCFPCQIRTAPTPELEAMPAGPSPGPPWQLDPGSRSPCRQELSFQLSQAPQSLLLGKQEYKLHQARDVPVSNQGGGCCNISHVCSSKAGFNLSTKELYAQLLPNHASQQPQPCGSAMLPQLFPPSAACSSQCTSSSQPTNTSTPSRPAP